MGLTNKEVFQNYHTVGVCVASPAHFCILLQEDEIQEGKTSVWTRFCLHNLERTEEERWGYRQFEGGWASPIAVHSKFKEFLVADRAGDVYYFGLGKNKQYEPSTGGIIGLKNIDGSIYGVGASRSVRKRLDTGGWNLSQELKNIPGAQQASGKGFKDIDGFSQNDIYAVGGERDVWHFDGEDWTPLDISRRPFFCTCVVCAEDGYVYIGGENGVIARGRGDIWKTYYPEDHEEDFKSIVSYRGRVFAGTEEDTFIIGEDLIPQPYDFEGQLRPIAGRFMYTAYDRLLIASNFNQVAFFDGEKWLDINGCSELTPVEEAHLMHERLRLIEEAKQELMDTKK